MIDSKTQTQMCGMELTVQKIERFTSSGAVAFENSERKLPDTAPLDFDQSGWIDLSAGAYLVTFNEIVNIPEMWLPWQGPALPSCVAGLAWRLPFGIRDTGGAARACSWSIIPLDCG
ncbi:MAG: hypothetical protein V9E95_09260 [Methanothrix soehngenii]